MSIPFTEKAYQTRLAQVRKKMCEQDLDAMVIGDPANMNWLTGFDAWSMYTPQVMVVLHTGTPIWLGRKMDAVSVELTTYLPSSTIVAYDEHYVQQPDTHPMVAIAQSMTDLGLAGHCIGYESDSYYFTPRALRHLQEGMGSTHWVEADLLVNWCRIIKSDDELAMMTQAARLVEGAMKVAYENIAPGVRQCDLAAKILAKQVGGTEDFGGDLSSLPPLILAGKAASAAHPMWDDSVFADGQTVALELGGARKRYNAALARTVQLGQGPAKVFDTATAVQEGLLAVLDTIKPGVAACDAHRAWQDVLNKHGLVKDSRIGYSIGVGYAPDWGEHTLSLRGDDKTVFARNMTLHVMLGMWMDGWGMELSETVAVTESGVRCLTQFDRDVYVV